MVSCCSCSGPSSGAKADLPLLCLVPRGGAGPGKPPPPGPHGSSKRGDFQLLDEAYIKKNFKLPQRALYLDPLRRPLITFPMTQERTTHFNMDRKTKLNQKILDGSIDPSEAISAPSVFPYTSSQFPDKATESKEEEEIIYILQLPDLEYRCPVHGESIRTPRFIWHSCKKPKKGEKDGMKQGGGPLKKPKPWLLSRHTDFDLLSQW